MAIFAHFGVKNDSKLKGSQKWVLKSADRRFKKLKNQNGVWLDLGYCCAFRDKNKNFSKNKFLENFLCLMIFA